MVRTFSNALALAECPLKQPQGPRSCASRIQSESDSLYTYIHFVGLPEPTLSISRRSLYHHGCGPRCGAFTASRRGHGGFFRATQQENRSCGHARLPHRQLIASTGCTGEGSTVVESRYKISSVCKLNSQSFGGRRDRERRSILLPPNLNQINVLGAPAVDEVCHILI